MTRLEEAVPTQAEHDAQGIEWVARWITWGGKFHIQVAGSEQTACGRKIPASGLRGATYSPLSCSLCERHADLYEAAEGYRRRCLEWVQDRRDESLERNRAGRFTVYRCRKCGTQHARPASGLGVPFCMSAAHEADLEEVEAVGPAWEGESA